MVGAGSESIGVSELWQHSDVLPVLIRIPGWFVEWKTLAKQYCYIFTDLRGGDFQRVIGTIS